MKLLDAVYEELATAGRPMSAKELAESVIKKGLWQTNGKTPNETVGAAIYMNMKREGANSRFAKCGKGLFAVSQTRHQPKEVQPDLFVRKGVENASEKADLTEDMTLPKSMLYAPALAILRTENGKPLGAGEIRNRIVAEYPDLPWAHGQGAVRAMLLKTAASKNTPIKMVDGSRPPKFYYCGEGGSPEPPTATPDEIIEKAVSDADAQLKRDLLERVRQMDETVFEELVNQLIERLGFGNHITTPPTHDHGIDGMIYGDSLGLNIVGVQAKHYTSRNVERDEIDKFIGALEGRNGVFVTTSAFSSGAKAKAEHTGSNSHIALIDGLKLVDFMVEKRLGVQEHKRFSLFRIDNDFFDDLEG